jgi:hypothetical protein
LSRAPPSQRTALGIGNWVIRAYGENVLSSRERRGICPRAVPPGLRRRCGGDRRHPPCRRTNGGEKGGPMASDISLAAGDGARRKTYAELAQAREISLALARRLARRHHWPRQVGNDGVVRVIVPLRQVRTVPRTTSPKAPETIGFSGPGPAQAMAHGTDPRTATGGPGTGLVGSDAALAGCRDAPRTARDRESPDRRAASHAPEERRRVIEILTGFRGPWWRRWFR